MKKTIEELWNEFKQELNINENKDKQSLNSSSSIEDYKNFAKYIKANKCKIKDKK